MISFDNSIFLTSCNMDFFLALLLTLSADFPKENWCVIMADVRYKIKDNSNKLKMCSNKFITKAMKNSFHKSQLDIICD